VVTDALMHDWPLDLSAGFAQVAPTNPEFEAIYEQWYDEVTRWVRAMGGPPGDQEDLAQDIFLTAHRRLQDFDGNNVGGWLYQITRRRVRDYRRLRWVRSVLSRQTPVPEGASVESPSPLEALQTNEKRRVLERLLEQLNQTERAAIVLFEVEGRSGQEIARIQGVPLNTVWARIHKARRKLRLELNRLNQLPRRQRQLRK